MFYRSINMLQIYYISVTQNMLNYLLRSLIKEKFVTICVVTQGGGGILKKLTNDDIGGEGSKTWHFFGDLIFEWPLKNLEY